VSQTQAEENLLHDSRGVLPQPLLRSMPLLHTESKQTILIPLAPCHTSTSSSKILI